LNSSLQMPIESQPMKVLKILLSKTPECWTSARPDGPRPRRAAPPFLDRVETVLAEACSMPVPHPRVEPGS